ncbi:MAG TPA: hypothetical protein VK419_00665 [Bryobacteraceae bacterium]|nr:hypothetical protein [Bryobacteraceae bacterium]
MMAGKWALWIAAASAIFAQGTVPQKAATDYPVHIALDDGFTMGAEYLVHSIPSPRGFYVVDDYLVVEVGVFGEKFAHLNVAADQFALRIDGLKAGQKTTIAPDPPGIIASGYTIGRMPGTPQGGDEEQMSIEDRIKHAAIPEGDVKTPFAGLLFFPFHGKMKAIKTMDLLYAGPAGKIALKMF